MNTLRKFWLVLVGAILIMGIIACSCNTFAQHPTATSLPVQPLPTEELPTATSVPIATAVPTASAAATQVPAGPAGKIAFTSDQSGVDAIYVINADGSNVSQLTDNQTGDRCPAWSPYGQKIAFSSDRDGNWQIYVMDPDSSHQTRLTNNKNNDGADPYGHCTGITWSPDGQKIAFASDRDATSQDLLFAIYVMNADGSHQTRLTDPKDGDTAPAWSPDGQKIAFGSDRGGVEIAVMNADGSNQTLLTDPKDNAYNPAWSPDGQKIAFDASQPNDPNAYRQINVMNADGSSPTLIASCKNGNDRYPAWSPDGQMMAFYSDCDGLDILYTMTADGSYQNQLTDYQTSNGFSGVSWSR